MPTLDTNTHESKRIVLITGTSSGFGLLTALEFAQSGFHVIATMRNLAQSDRLLQQAQQLGLSEQIEVMQLNVTDHQAILHIVSQIMEKHQHIDVLVNNAGVAYGGFIEEIPMEDWSIQLETNFFGLVAVTQAVIPHMRVRREGRIINISSVSGRFGFPGYAPYAASKFAVEGFSESLRLEMLPFGIYTVLIEPGSYNTDIWSKGFDQISSRASEESPYRQSLEAILQFSRQSAETADDPRKVAQKIVQVAKMKSPRLRYMLGKGSSLSLLGKTLLPWKWFERIVLKQLSK